MNRRTWRIVAATMLGLGAGVGLALRPSEGPDSRGQHSFTLFAAAAAVVSCGGDIAGQFSEWRPTDPWPQQCGTNTVYAQHTVSITCGGTESSFATPNVDRRCKNTSCPEGWWDPDYFDGNSQGRCSTPPALALTCVSLCAAAPTPTPTPPACGKDGGEGGNAGGDPVALSSLDVSTSLTLFRFSDAGFPPSFDVEWSRYDVSPHPPFGPPLGAFLSHSFSLAFWKGSLDGGTTWQARVRLRRQRRPLQRTLPPPRPVRPEHCRRRSRHFRQAAFTRTGTASTTPLRAGISNLTALEFSRMGRRQAHPMASQVALTRSTPTPRTRHSPSMTMTRLARETRISRAAPARLWEERSVVTLVAAEDSSVEE